MVYFTSEELKVLHHNIIKNSKGLFGYVTENEIEKVCHFVQEDIYYPNFEDKVEYLMFSLSKNHFFNDGNKRTALFAGLYFLKLNNCIIDEKIFLVKFEIEILKLVENKINRTEFKKIIKKYLNTCK